MEAAARISDEYYKSIAYKYIAWARLKSGDIAGAKATAARITSENHKSDAYENIAVAQANTGDNEGARESFARAMEAAARISDEDDKASAYKEIAEAQAKAGYTSGAKRAAAAQAQAEARAKARKMVEDEIKDWTRLAMSGDFSKPALTDLQGFFVSLKDKKPHELVVSLANAARDMAEALKKVRKTEAKWQKKRAKAAK